MIRHQVPDIEPVVLGAWIVGRESGGTRLCSGARRPVQAAAPHAAPGRATPTPLPSTPPRKPVMPDQPTPIEPPDPAKVWHAQVLTLFPEMFPGPLGVSLVGTVAGTLVLTGLFKRRSTVVGAYFTIGALGGVATRTHGQRDAFVVE